MDIILGKIEKKWQQRWKDTNAYKVAIAAINPSIMAGYVRLPKRRRVTCGPPAGYIAQRHMRL